MNTFRNILLGVSFVAMSALAACGSSYDCASTACENDPKPDQAAIDQCEKALDAECGSEGSDYVKCAQDNVKCTDDGKTDPASGLEALAACADELGKWTSCCSGKTDSAACSGLTGG